MDPTAAFSLVCGIIQVIDFSSKVAKKCHELYRDGVSSEHKEAEEMASHLIDLRAKLELPDESVGKDLLDLGSKCSSTAEELIAELEKLKIDGSHTKRQVARKAFKIMRKGSSIDHIQKRLAEYEKHLDSRVLFELRFVDLYDHHFIINDYISHLSLKIPFLRRSNLVYDALSADS